MTAPWGALWGKGKAHPLAGMDATGARGELLAFLISMLLPGPVQVAISSLALVGQIKALLAMLPIIGIGIDRVGGQWFSPKYCFSTDGDLWALAQDIILARGTATISCRFVPAGLSRQEAGRQELAEGDWYGSDIAMRAAADGLGPVQASQNRFMKVLMERRLKALRVVHAVQDMQVDILREDSKIRGHLKALSPKDPKRCILAPIQPPEGQAMEVRRCHGVAWMRERQDTWRGALHSFMIEHEWIVATEPLPLIGLLVAFELATGAKAQTTLQRRMLEARACVRELALAFRKELQEVLRHSLHPGDAGEFRICSTGKHAFSCLGIKGYMPCINMWPRLDAEGWGRVSEGLISLRPRLQSGWREAMATGKLAMPWTSLSLKGVPQWRDLSGCRRRPSGAGDTGGFTLVCTECTAHIYLTTKPVREGSSWPKVRCRACRASGRAGFLKCARCMQLLKRCGCTGAVGQEGQSRLSDFAGFRRLA